MHVILTVTAIMAIILQLTFRVPGSRALSIIPLVSLLLTGLHGLLIAKAILWRAGWSDVVPSSVLTLERVSAAIVVAFFGYGAVLLANARLYASVPYEQAAEVVAISSRDSEFWGVLPYAWADLRIEDTGGRVERVLLTGDERRSLWGGEAVKLQLRRGFFNVPCVMHIFPNVERQSQAVLRVTPTAARALYMLTNVYLAQNRWGEAMVTALRYITFYPDNTSVARHFGEVLESADRFGDVVALLERVRHPDYDVSVLLGRALARVNRVAEGIAVLERAARLQPDEPDAYRDLGLIHLAAGDVERATAMFENALKRQPRSPDVQAQLRRLRGSQP
jgi:tetratricopeptide (TPR) repeat protein